ncbi:MAG: 3-phosphoshikimate 1-carboxyvinyltransferase, partial [Oscillospiraceae bacterium]|nr:3-phosphoshikimate 1-carboxyvinyltransferase [Oscillospiraceae bacterium]
INLLYEEVAPEQRMCAYAVQQSVSGIIGFLAALGAGVLREKDSVTVTPVAAVPAEAELYCRDSGSTLRFLLPVAGALGVTARFHMQGRLAQRPLSPLDGELMRHGMTLQQQGDTLLCSGKLQAGAYTLAGNVSSQFVTGLLMALPLLEGDSTLQLTAPLESAGYVALTEQVLRQSGIRFEKEAESWRIQGAQRYALPAAVQAEADWSNAAVWLCMGALLEDGIAVTGLCGSSLQGDREILPLLRRFGAEVSVAENAVSVRRGVLRGIDIAAENIPDLVPVLAVLACAAEGETHITGAARLRLKESDRLQSTAALITALGGCVQQLPDGLTVTGSAARYPLAGGSAHAAADHRIAMAAAVAALLCRGELQLADAQSVEKSYPQFWGDRASLL